MSDGITTVDKVYAQTNRSKYSDESRALSGPLTVEVAHQTSKDGTVSSVIYANDDVLVPGLEDRGTQRLKVQVKLMYPTNSGRTDIPATALERLADIKSFIDANIASLLNKEV
jgi:hypothetical protein